MQELSKNPILQTDSYKVGHWLLRKESVEYLANYLGPRGGKYTEVVTAGYMPILKNYLSTPVTMADIDQAEWFLNGHLGPGIFNREAWEQIVTKHNGYMPIKVRAVPEGTVLPNTAAMLTTINTDPDKQDWAGSYIEPLFLQHVWYASTIASMTRAIKKVLIKYLRETTDLDDDAILAVVAYMLHDFGYRGASSTESAKNGGCAHLYNFNGTDTMVGLVAAIELYKAQPTDAMSVIASEHTVMCMNANADEKDDFPSAEKMVEVLEQRTADGSFQIVSAVADTYDVYRFAGEFIGERLASRVAATTGKLVIRPDSGDPTTVPCEVVEILMEKVGYTTNEKGYKELPPYLGVLQGDGINEDSLPLILEEAKKRKLAASNFVFGMGGGLLQGPNRDDAKFAMKGSAVCIDGIWKDIFKDPITDPGKKSLKGVVTTVRQQDGTVVTKRVSEVLDTDVDLMETVWENGILKYHPTFEEIRARAAEGILD